jgi:tetratricopeptide (TPR) repeat protein
MGQVYLAMGSLTAAGLRFNEALNIWRKTLGQDYPEAVYCMISLAYVYRNMSSFAKAKFLLQQAQGIWKQRTDEANQEYASILNELANWHQDINQLERAMELLQQVLNIQRQYLKENHPELSITLSRLAELYYDNGQLVEATSLLQQAVDIWTKDMPQQHPHYAHCLHVFAKIHHRLRHFNDAKAFYEQALEIRQKVVNSEHPDVAYNLYDTAWLLMNIGEFIEAEKLTQQALELRRRILSESHPDIAASLKQLAMLYAATEREAEGFDLMKQSISMSNQIIGHVFSTGSEAQRMNYLRTIQEDTNLFLALSIHNSISSNLVVQDGLNLVLRRKAIGAEVAIIQRLAVMTGQYKALLPKLRQLTMLRMQIAQQTLAGAGMRSAETYQNLLKEWNAQKEQLEVELAQQIPEVDLTQRLQAINIEKVTEGLPTHAALIEFIRFNNFDFTAIPARNGSSWKASRYLAFIVFGEDRNNNHMIDIGEAEPIDQLIADYRATITGETDHRGLFFGDEQQSNETSDLELGHKLRTAIFDPLLPALGDCRRLFFSPDGDLSRLPFEILPTDDSRRLLDEYQISYVNVGRDILRFGADYTGEPAEPMVVADPDFDLAGEQEEQREQPVDEIEAILEWSAVGGRRSKDLGRAGLHFGRLPGTRTEGQKIAEMLDVSPVMANAALEKKLKQVQSPRILHIATHGFFLPDQKQDPNEEQLDFALMRGMDGDWGRLSHGMENPLLRSGLALAGANTWLKNGNLPPEAEDGILTAEDVTGLDLLATELVVLSACETGLGKVQVGEGVFGLRRAFVLAGAKTLVMSLWKVPDQQTQELMTDFYRRILAGEPRAEALRQAQLTMKEKYPNPLYWGAFICQGDPGPLAKVDS